MTITSVTQNNLKVWLKNSAKWQVSQNLAIKSSPKIINHNILHTPSNVSYAKETFSHTLDEAMSDGLAKACDLKRKSICRRENQLFHWKSNRMRNLHAYIKRIMTKEKIHRQLAGQTSSTPYMNIKEGTVRRSHLTWWTA